ncbi:MAG: presenilin family intramembrane aspartyl protease [Candidatus Micrarchaeota archaeon]|nr:presenilin family intramembrane aspartyl protease [Candidatus Micrarchaeota archaeon]
MNFFDKTQTKIFFLFFSSQIIALLYFFSLLFIASLDKEFFENFSIPVLKDDILFAILLFFYIIFIAILNLLFLKFFRSFLLLKIFEFISLFFTLTLFSLPFIFILSKDPLVAFAISLLIGLFFTLVKDKFFQIKNILVVISCATIGILVGFSFGFIAILIFSILLAIYDFLAVFKTRHMLALAQAIISQKLAFAIFSQPQPKAVKAKAQETKKEQFLVLGGGDILAVSLFIPSVFLEFGLLAVVFMILSSSLGVYLLLDFSIKNKVALPALPPIFFSAMLGLVLGVLFSNLMLL